MDKKKKIKIIAAIQHPNMGIGYDNELLYSIPEDMKRFRELTKNNIVIMGKNTWFSIPEKFRPLLNRFNIVLNEENIGGADYTANSIEDALKESEKHSGDIWIIGGAYVYKEWLPLADELYLTIIEGDKKALVFFPEYDKLFKELQSEKNFSEKLNKKFYYKLFKKR